MSSAQYKSIGSPLGAFAPGVHLRSTTGTSMEAWGLTSCLVHIGRKVYAQSFIVCNKMMTNVIVGRDFLSTYKLSITWGDEGMMEVLEGQEPVIQMGEVHQYPAYVGGTSKSASTHSGHCSHPCESPTFRKENTFPFCSIKRKPRFADELCSIPIGLCHLEGWPSTHHTTNNQFRRGASITCGGDPIRVL